LKFYWWRTWSERFLRNGAFSADAWVFYFPGKHLKASLVWWPPWLDLEYTKQFTSQLSMQAGLSRIFLQWSNDFNNVGVIQVKGTLESRILKNKTEAFLTFETALIITSTLRWTEWALKQEGKLFASTGLNRPISNRKRNFVGTRKFWFFTKVTGGGSDAFSDSRCICEFSLLFR